MVPQSFFSGQAAVSAQGAQGASCCYPTSCSGAGGPHCASSSDVFPPSAGHCGSGSCAQPCTQPCTQLSHRLRSLLQQPAKPGHRARCQVAGHLQRGEGLKRQALGIAVILCRWAVHLCGSTPTTNLAITLLLLPIKRQPPGPRAHTHTHTHIPEFLWIAQAASHGRILVES